MFVIGIDPGLAITGYGLIQQDEKSEKLNVVTFGAIRTSSKTQVPDRLLQIYLQLKEILNFHRPDTAAVEKLFFQSNVRTAIDVGQGRGVAILALAEAKIKLAEYSPLEVKQAVVGYGGADKNQMQQMVKAILQLNELPQPDDAADALAIAICHIHSSKMKALDSQP